MGNDDGPNTSEPLLASTGWRHQSSCEQLWQLWSMLRCHRPIPHDIRVTSTTNWVDLAAESIVHHGVCCLRPPASSHHTLLPASLLERCRSEVRPRLDRYLDLAARASATGGGGPLKFVELYSRAPWEHRFDILILRKPSICADSEDAALGDNASWMALLASIDRLLRPVLRASGFFGDDSEVSVEGMGVVDSLDLSLIHI